MFPEAPVLSPVAIALSPVAVGVLASLFPVSFWTTESVPVPFFQRVSEDPPPELPPLEDPTLEDKLLITVARSLVPGVGLVPS